VIANVVQVRIVLQPFAIHVTDLELAFFQVIQRLLDISCQCKQASGVVVDDGILRPDL